MFNKQQLCDIQGRIDLLESGLDALGSRSTAADHGDKITELAAHQVVLQRSVEQLTLAVAEGIERVDRAENRIKATIARARKQLKESGFESPGLDAEAHDLRLVDGTGGEERGVPAVRDEVAQPAEQASSVEGVPLATLQRVRGAIL